MICPYMFNRFFVLISESVLSTHETSLTELLLTKPFPLHKINMTESCCSEFIKVIEHAKPVCSAVKKAIRILKDGLLDNFDDGNEHEKIIKAWLSSITQDSISCFRLCPDQVFSREEDYQKHLDDHFSSLGDFFVSNLWQKGAEMGRKCGFCEAICDENEDKRSFASEHLRTCGREIELEKRTCYSKFETIPKGEITCDFCYKRFKKNIALNKHLRRCELKLAYDSARQQIDKGNDDDDGVPCFTCQDVYFRKERDYQAHLNSHFIALGQFFESYFINEKSHEKVCPLCKDAFAEDEEEDVRHFISRHFNVCGNKINEEKEHCTIKFNQRLVLSCERCGKNFTKKIALKKHMTHCDNGILYQEDCSRCRDLKNSSNRKDMVLHIFDSHSNQIQLLSKVSPSSFTSLIKKSRHYLKMDEIYRCFHCALIFDSYSMENHQCQVQITFHQENHRDRMCVLCGDMCPVAYKTRLDLKLHYVWAHYQHYFCQKFETPSFPTSCIHSDCKYRVVESQRELAEHYGIRHSYLSKAFIQDRQNRDKLKPVQNFLFPSLQRKQGGKIYRCPLCNVKCTSILSRISHLCSHFKQELIVDYSPEMICLYGDEPCGHKSKNKSEHGIHVGRHHRLLYKILKERGIQLPRASNETKKCYKASSESNPFTCQNCKETFASKEHRYLHTCNSVFDKAWKVGKHDLSRSSNIVNPRKYRERNEKESESPK